jgi:phosphohistidine phosphatase
MKRLMLLRHAKALQPEPDEADFDRRLDPGAPRRLDRLGQHLADNDLVPGFILCSSARRTRETLAGLLGHFHGEPDIRLSRRLYDESEGDYRAIIRTSATEADRLMLIGHNPAIAATFQALAGSGDGAAIHRIGNRFPTAGLAIIDFMAGSWTEAGAGTGRLAAFIDPRDLD